MFIYPVDIDQLIEKIRSAGGKVTKKAYAIYVRPTVKLTDEHYPLEVIESDNLPIGTDCLVALKGEYVSK